MKKIIPVTILFLIFTSFTSLNAQWAALYGGSGDDWANSVQQTRDGGYIIAGYTESFWAELSDIWVVKLSFTGDIEWQYTYGGSGDEEAYSIQQTNDGGYIVAGYTDSFGAGRRDFWVLKLDSEGITEWEHTFGGSGDDWASSVQQTDDDGFIVGGSSDSFGIGGADFWLLKLYSDGSVEWQNVYILGVNGYLKSIQETSDGGYIAAGQINPSINNSYDLLILKLDSIGIREWQRYYGGSQDDWAISVQEADDEGYFIAGYTKSFGSGGWDFWALKLTSSGDIDWEKTYGKSGDDWASSAQKTNDGGFIVAGQTDSFGAGLSDFWLLKLSSSGTVEWQMPYGETGAEGAFSIQQTDDAGFVVAGSTYSYGDGDLDILVLKLYSDGTIDPSCELPGSSNATITTTVATLGIALVTLQNTGVIPQDTDVFPQLSDSDVYMICEDRPEISGTVKTEGGVGIEGVTITFSESEGEATTDVDGNYSHSVSYGWSGTATPSKAGYGFSPSSQSYTDVISDQTGEDYTGFIVHVISGYVRTGRSEGIEEVTITFSNDGGEATTDADGSYSFTVKEGWSGTATPSKTCYSFTPPSRDYMDVTSDYTDQDYTGTFLTYTISGTIRLASTSAPLSGAVMTGLPGNPTTDASGYYEATIDCGWSGTVIPTRIRYVFSPAFRKYDEVSSDQTGQDYLAYPGWIVSGLVRTDEDEGIDGVTIVFSNDGGSTDTEVDGSYSHTVIEGWSGTATPSKVGYSFLPSSRDYTNVTSDMPGQNFTGELISFTLTINADEGGTTQPAPGSYVYTYGTAVDIEAVPNDKYKFSQWSEDVPSGHENDNPVTIYMDADKSIRAQFDKEKLCFIATAAYGSPLHPYVKMLRDFRERYLMSNKIGRKLVGLYNKYSPFIADLIARNKALKVIVRIQLVPFIAFSYMAVCFGPIVTTIMLFLIFAISIFSVSFYRRRLI